MDDLPYAPQPDPRNGFLRSLPTVPLTDVNPDENCAICFLGFDDICAEPPEQLELEEGDFIELHGLTKLTNCGHIFCKRDLVQWMKTSHGSCPTCRDVFLELPKEDEDAESSDGGEYLPDEDDLMRSDDFMTDEDPFTDEDMSDWGGATEEDDYSFSSDPATGEDEDAEMSDARECGASQQAGSDC
ncbi:hypothetical protein AURDEDRAFT_183489 [Auricularia subglabra TFB-10046 SS5]|nr:hypothetical protein AURDEDRAFT_183489 [Auricularia subglabra TFB-10046 SS5]